MKAFQFDNVNDGLCLQHVPVPKPSDNEVLVFVEAAGICHSDAHVLKGEGGSWLSKRPITLGHEVAGTVEEVGTGVTEFKTGDRVGVALIPTDDNDWGHIIGVGRDGGFAEKVLVPAKVLVPLPQEVSFAAAAVASDSIATAYHAVVAEADATPSKTIAIVGLGGLGLNGVRIAEIQGATVLGVDIDEKKFPEALASGAKACFRKLSEIPENTTIDVVVDFAGVGVTTQDALQRVKSSGTVVLVGVGVPSFELSTHTMMLRSLILRGSRGSTIAEYRAVLDLIASGQIKPKLQEVPFSEIPESLQKLERLEVIGRLFTKPNI